MLVWLLFIPIFKTCVIWESIQSVKNLKIYSQKNIQVFIEVVPQFKFHEKRVKKSTHLPLNPTLVLLQILPI
jgi:hypothetical protein